MRVRRNVPAFLAVTLVVVAIGLLTTPVAGTAVYPIEGNVSTSATTFHLQTDVTGSALANTTVNYSVNVTNIGNQTDTLEVTLNVENTTVDTTAVRLDPKNSTEVVLSTTYTHVQEYNISFNTLAPVSISVDKCGYNKYCPEHDPDDDLHYEDVNRDGNVNIIDVGALLANLHSETVQNNIEYFDFNNDGAVNIIDVGKLLNEVRT